jgi:hypothetical protein
MHHDRQAATGPVLHDLPGGRVGMKGDVAAAHRHEAQIDQLDQIPPHLGYADSCLVCDGLEADAKATQFPCRLLRGWLAYPANVMHEPADCL